MNSSVALFAFFFFFFFAFFLTSLVPSLASAAYTVPNSPTDYYPDETDDYSSPSSPHQSAPPAPSASVQTQLVECSNASLRADFGTACLKKAINSPGGQQTQLTGSRVQGSGRQPNSRPTPGRTRYFSVKPMVGVVRKTGPFGMKSPALSARELYASKGYTFPVKSVKTVSGSNLNVYPYSPVNKFYNTKPQQPAYRPPTPRLDDHPPLTPILTSEEDEWREADREQIVPLPVPANEAFQPGHQAPQQPKVTKSSPSLSNPAPAPTGTGTGQYAEELEMLQSLKRSLGILGAQASNLKQRTVLLYREARRRKLYFFDALLSKTHSYLTEKQAETRNAQADIDTAIRQIQAHHEVAALASLRRTSFFYYDPSASSRAFRTRRNLTKRHSAAAAIDPKELDQLILDALNHAKRMMTIVRELNEALDEFEEQFNLPRFEPNSIDDNSVDGGGKEDF